VRSAPTDDTQVVGSSPEILVRLQGGEFTVRPIAGTRQRGATPEADAALDAELLADPKERAEHLVLIDLGRNEGAGRNAQQGTCAVPGRRPGRGRAVKRTRGRRNPSTVHARRKAWDSH